MHDAQVLLAPLQRQADTRGFAEFSDVLSGIMSLDPGDPPLVIQKFRDFLESFDDTAYDTLMDYMQSSGSLDVMPYQFEATCEIIQRKAPTSTAIHTKLQKTLLAIVEEQKLKIFNLDAEPVHHIDIIVDTVLSILRTHQDTFDAGVGKAVVLYVWSRRKPGEGITRALGRCNPNR